MADKSKKQEKKKGGSGLKGAIDSLLVGVIKDEMGVNEEEQEDIETPESDTEELENPKKNNKIRQVKPEKKIFSDDDNVESTFIRAEKTLKDVNSKNFTMIWVDTRYITLLKRAAAAAEFKSKGRSMVNIIVADFIKRHYDEIKQMIESEQIEDLLNI